MTLSDLIKNYRDEHNLSQRQFASACGLSNGYISMLEKGVNPNTKQQITPSLPVLKKLAKGMRLSLEKLLPQIDDFPVDLASTKNSFRVIDHCGIGDLLRGFREEKKVALGTLASKIHISAEHLCQIESGRTLPSLDMVDAIMDVLDIPISTLGNNRNYIDLGEKEDIRLTNNDFLFVDPYTYFDYTGMDDDSEAAIPYQYKDFFIDALSDDEIRLLFSFARLNRDGRNRILENMEMLEKFPRYQRNLPLIAPDTDEQERTDEDIERQVEDFRRRLLLEKKQTGTPSPSSADDVTA